MSDELDVELEKIAGRVGSGWAQPTTPRKLVQKFGFARRGANVVELIRSRLARHGLGTRPDFEAVYADEEIHFVGSSKEPLHVVRLKDAYSAAHEKGEPQLVSVRTLLRWFGAERRGPYVVERIRGALSGLELDTDPDFETVHVDSEVHLVRVLVSTSDDVSRSGSNESEQSVRRGEGRRPSDAAFLVGALPQANMKTAAGKPLVVVQAGTSLKAAVTKMLSHDVSFLPVMNGERTIKGVVTWKGIASHLSLGAGTLNSSVDKVVTQSHEVRPGQPFFEVIPTIIKNGCVVVRGETNEITGIITTADLGEKLQALAGPFIRLGEIEQHVRRIIERGEFTVDELLGVRDPADPRNVDGVSGLTLGESIRVLQEPASWDRVGLQIDRQELVARLEEARTIRNHVMHFEPESPTPQDLDTLERICRFLRNLST